MESGEGSQIFPFLFLLLKARCVLPASSSFWKNPYVTYMHRWKIEMHCSSDHGNPNFLFFFLSFSVFSFCHKHAFLSREKWKDSFFRWASSALPTLPCPFSAGFYACPPACPPLCGFPLSFWVSLTMVWEGAFQLSSCLGLLEEQGHKEKLSFEAEGGRSAVYIYKLSLFIWGDFGGGWWKLGGGLSPLSLGSRLQMALPHS